ncbi:MAG: hypothetical protein HC800_19580 [Phormidesmis sp. RL_2_1]|nr:hypothetical protein [Phormidesmis sp. RL_2_1]
MIAYDAEGNLLSLTDASGNQTRYFYDELGRRDYEVIEVDGQFLSRSHVYDAASNLLKREDRNGRSQLFDYDALNRQTQERWLDEQGEAIRDIDYTYDAASQLTAVSDPDSAYVYSYDAAGRLVSTDNNGTLSAPAVRLTYGYDAVNNRTSVTDAITGIQAGVETFTYDDLNRVTRITQSGNGAAQKRVDITYDAASQMAGVQRYSDLAGTQSVADTTYAHDAAGRLTALTHAKNGSPMAAYGFTYDAANRLTKLITPDGSSDYSYNQRDELTRSDHSYQDDESYSYDDTGNRTNAGYVVGKHNRLLSDGTYNYSYDNEGNRTRRVTIATGEITEYGWDTRNRMTSVVTKASGGSITEAVEYTYDVYDRRIAKSVDGDGSGAAAATAEHYVYDGEHIALVFDGAGNQTSRYLHGPQIDQVLAEETAAGEVRWALSDHQGSVRDVISSAGTVLDHLTYDSYGQVKGETQPTVDFRFGYTGRERDEETGLYYYRARYFDPAVGTFVSEDPLGFGAGDANVYRYVFNSPTNYVDPTGLDDVRWPFNGSVRNSSRNPVYPLISSEEEDHYEILHPDQGTPDAPGRSEDVDGVWVQQQTMWLFYPNRVGLMPLRVRGGLPTVLDGGLNVTDSGVFDGAGNEITPWNPCYPGINLQNRPETRGRPVSNIPPNFNYQYPDASLWNPVLEGRDTQFWNREWNWRSPIDSSPIDNDIFQNGVERVLSPGIDATVDAWNSSRQYVNDVGRGILNDMRSLGFPE